MRIILSAFLVVALACSARAALVEQEVDYSDGTTTMKGFLVWDDATEGLRPGVLVVHEWWGHNEYARRRARELAREGYIAMAVDMYGEGRTAEHPKDAGAFAGEVMGNMAQAAARFRAARVFLETQTQTDPARLAAIGYCFGGGMVLHMARIGEDLAVVASFHGSLRTVSSARPGEVRARVLVYHGGADVLVPPEDVVAFEQEMTKAGVNYKFVTYPDAPHSFTSPEADDKAVKFELPLGYDAEADRASWADLLEELSRRFQPQPAPADR
ncbi:MAG TPA: dienelactone hydrolase family protein [Kiritimatiellia bacterium]|nr:dienelactone hydrolase family protein [Kiritimatiellia bacterium]